MKNIMEKVKACKEKQFAALFLLTVLTLFLAPGGKAYAAVTANDAKPWGGVETGWWKDNRRRIPRGRTRLGSAIH